MTVEFVDELPAHGGGRPGRKWAAILEELKASPGRWAKVADGVTPSIYSAARQGLIKKGCEVSSRTVDGERLIFARYVGE